MDTNTAAKILGPSLGYQVNTVRESCLPGLWEVYTDRGLVYLTEAGTEMIVGNVFSLKDQLIFNLTEDSMCRYRKSRISNIKEGKILFASEAEQYQVTAFIDITCVYCRKMFSELSEYLTCGISLCFLPYSRSGTRSVTAAEMESIWTTEDPQQQLHEAMMDRLMPRPSQQIPLVSAMHELAAELGVNHTPSLILHNGSLIPGYQPAPQLFKLLTSL